MFQEMEAAGLELIPDQPKPEHPAPESIFFVVRHRPPWGCGFLCQRLMADRKAELDVCLDLPCVGGAVEKPEFHGPFCEGGV